MLRALDETVITGVPTTGPFHKLLLNHHAFKSGNVDTGFIPKYIDELKTPPPTSKVRPGPGWLLLLTCWVWGFDRLGWKVSTQDTSANKQGQDNMGYT